MGQISTTIHSRKQHELRPSKHQDHFEELIGKDLLITYPSAEAVAHMRNARHSSPAGYHNRHEGAHLCGHLCCQAPASQLSSLMQDLGVMHLAQGLGIFQLHILAWFALVMSST